MKEKEGESERKRAMTDWKMIFFLFSKFGNNLSSKSQKREKQFPLFANDIEMIFR